MLVPGKTYERKDVHDIFVPDGIFTPQSGSWGIHGIIAIPNRPGDFVFFVTFGTEQSVSFPLKPGPN